MSENLKKIVIILSVVFVWSIASFTLWIAYMSGIKWTGIFGIWFFITFLMIIVLIQLIPGSIPYSGLSLEEGFQHEV